MADALPRLLREAGVARPDVILSGATGVASLAEEEAQGLKAALPDTRIRATGDVIGHPIEAVPPFGAAIAAALCAEGRAREVAITSVGHRSGEGVIRVVAA